MKRLMIVAIMLFLAVPLMAAAPASPCRLDHSVLQAYDGGPNTTEEQWRDSRRAVSEFIGCPPSSVDAASRRVFFEVVKREFATEHTADLAQWSKKRPGSDALYEGISLFQSELKGYMDRLVDRNDVEFKSTILRYGNAAAIAKLGPAVKHDVVAMLGAPSIHGLRHQYNAQEAALGALGLWIDPSNTDFSPAEKANFTGIVTGVLPVLTNTADKHQYRLAEGALKALSHAEGAEAEASVRRWMASQPNGALQRLAASSADAIHKRTQKHG